MKFERKFRRVKPDQHTFTVKVYFSTSSLLIHQLSLNPKQVYIHLGGHVLESSQTPNCDFILVHLQPQSS